jgi:hypothetical protein
MKNTENEKLETCRLSPQESKVKYGVKFSKRDGKIVKQWKEQLVLIRSHVSGVCFEEPAASQNPLSLNPPSQNPKTATCRSHHPECGGLTHLLCASHELLLALLNVVRALFRMPLFHSRLFRLRSEVLASDSGSSSSLCS